MDYDMVIKQPLPRDEAMDGIKLEYDDIDKQGKTKQEHLTNNDMFGGSTPTEDIVIEDIDFENDDAVTLGGISTEYTIAYDSECTSSLIPISSAKRSNIFFTDDMKVNVIEEIITTEDLTNIDIVSRSSLPTDVGFNSIKVEDCSVMDQDIASGSTSNTGVKSADVVVEGDNGDDTDDMTSKEAGPRRRQFRRCRYFRPSPGCPLSSPIRKKKFYNLSVGEQELIINIYKYIRSTWPKDTIYLPKSNHEIVEKTCEISGISKSTVYRILRDLRDTHTVVDKSPMIKRKSAVIERMDDFQKTRIRKKVHQLFLAKELPRIYKILEMVNKDPELPYMFQAGIRVVLRHIKFKFIWRKRKCAVIDSPEMVLWRLKYLEEIQRFRDEGQRIFYLDETWVNVDTSIESARQAFLEGLYAGAKNLRKNTDEGKRFMLLLIGSEEGLLEDCEWVFESSTTDDYHKSMDAVHFEEWFGKILTKLRSGDVIVMDDASYHSRRFEKTPTMSWRKKIIQEWLKSKQIPFASTETKASLIEKVERIKKYYKSYVTDEMAKKKGITVLRIPRYHCELNPIELLWADIKGYVASKNTTKLSKVKKLLTESLTQVTPEKWEKCIQHILNVERKMRKMDNIIDRIGDRFLMRVGCRDSSTETATTSCSDSE